MELNERIRIIINENKLKQKEFAHNLGISEGYVSRLLRSLDKNVSPALAKLIEEKYGFSSEWVLSGVGDPKKQLLNSPIEELINNHRLSELDRSILERYSKLKPYQKRIILDLIDSMIVNSKSDQES